MSFVSIESNVWEDVVHAKHQKTRSKWFKKSNMADFLVQQALLEMIDVSSLISLGYKHSGG